MNNTIELVSFQGILCIQPGENTSFKAITPIVFRYPEGDIDTFPGEFDENNLLDLQKLHDVLFDLRETALIHREIKYAKFPEGHVHHPLAF